MKIKELNLTGFGKFTNKRILFQDGINIIYGENEAGKSTLHSFIDGMFYGFLKPYVSRTIYLDTHEKYKPWSGTKYSGTIKFEYDGCDYTIERDFTKGNESSRVLIDSTGEDIVNYIDTGNKGRIYQPGYHFFGFSDAVFSNTISIKQVGSRTDENLANELRDRLANTTTSLDENLSVEKAIEDLNKSLKEIGTSRAPTSSYGKTMTELDDLTIERDRVLNYKDDYNEILENSSVIDAKLKMAEKDMDLLKSNFQDAIIIDKKNIHKRALKVLDEMKKLEEKEGKYRRYKDITMEAYTEGVRLKDGIEGLEKRQVELNRDLGKVEDIVDKYDNSESSSEGDRDIEADYLEFEELEEEKNKVLFSINNSDMEFLKRDYESMAGKLKVYKLIIFLSSILAIVIGSYGFIDPNIYSIIFPFMFFIVAIFSISKLRKSNLATNDLKEKYMEFKRLSKWTDDLVEDIEEKQRGILKSHDVNSKIEFKKIYSEKQLEVFRRKESKSILLDNLNKKEFLTKELAHIRQQIDKNTLNLERILEDNLSTNIGELKEAVNKREVYKSTLGEIKTNNLILDKILGPYRLEELENDLSNYGKDIDGIEVYKSKESLKLEIREKQAFINDLKIASSGIKERLDMLNKEVKKLVEIDEEIGRKNTLIEKLDKKRASLELAKETIEGLSKDIHQQFAPEINEKVGRIIKSISNGKYESIRLDDKLNLGVINPETNQLVDVDNLSGGTIDQVYFSLRFGIIDSIGDKQPPLILDDCFIQYDNHRLSNMMGYLSEVARGRQVLLFTCHKRELEALKAMNKEFNLINLS